MNCGFCQSFICGKKTDRQNDIARDRIFSLFTFIAVRNPSVTVKKSNKNMDIDRKSNKVKKIPQPLINKGTAVLFYGPSGGT